MKARKGTTGRHSGEGYCGGSTVGCKPILFAVRTRETASGFSAWRTGGRLSTPPHTAAADRTGQEALSAYRSSRTLRVLCGFTCRQETTTGQSTAGDFLMFSPVVGGRGLV